LKEREHLGDPGFDGRIILMWGNLLRLAQGFGEENLKETVHLGDPRFDGRIILMRVFCLSM